MIRAMGPLQCLSCKHYVGGRFCLAFPDGIPQAVWVEDHDHRKPFPGDNGIRYEEIPLDPGHGTKP